MKHPNDIRHPQLNCGVIYPQRGTGNQEEQVVQGEWMGG